MALDYDAQVQDSFEMDIDESHFELPDGKIIKFTNKIIYDSAEVIIRPDKFKENTLGLVDQIKISLSKCETQLSDIVTQNLVLTGGVSQT